VSKFRGNSRKKIDFNQKSFSFTHRYDQEKFKLDRLNNIRDKFQIKINNRLILSSVIFSTIFFAIAIQIIHLNFFFNPNEKFFSNNHLIIRPNIVDRNNVSLTANLKMQNIQIFPKQIYNKEKFAKRVSNIHNDWSEQDLIEKIKGNKSFYLDRNVLPKDLQKVINLGETGIVIKDSYKRLYVHQNLFSHIIGEVNDDNIGVSGIELSIDNLSEDIVKNNEQKIVSSLDVRIQNIVRDEIIKGMDIFEAKGGAGIVININNGEILSIVSLPDFDPNNPNADPNFQEEYKFNRNTKGLYEFGSVMKTFTAAIGLEEKIFNINSKYKINKVLKIGNDTITDAHATCSESFCSVEKIFSKSSNIGTVKMIRDIGINKQKEYLNKLGLFNRINLNIPELSSPITPDPWLPVSTDSISYGYGLSVSPLHLALATATVLNGGYIIEPPLIKKEKDYDYKERIFSKDTSEKMRYLFSKVITEGTARSAFGYNKSLIYKHSYRYNYEYGYLVGGKTGTARTNSSGFYDKNLGKLATFIAAFPIDKPKYLVLISLDSPKPIDDREHDYDTFGKTNAGWNSARISREVIDRISPILDTKSKYKLNDSYIIINTSFN
jgi:cell division protein FtsI (penicillin-binding protein 3)